MSTWEDWGSDHSIVIRIAPRRGDRFYVYVAWGRGRRPLYVGKARNPWVRFGDHMGQKPWAEQVRRLECHGFRTEREAAEAELEAILALDPIHNIIRTEPTRIVRARDERWKQIQAEKRADLLARQEHEAARSLAWAEAKAARAAAKIDEPPKPIRVPRPIRVDPPATSPHRRKRLRHVAWREDIFTPDQLEIISRVQNRGGAR